MGIAGLAWTGSWWELITVLERARLVWTSLAAKFTECTWSLEASFLLNSLRFETQFFERLQSVSVVDGVAHTQLTTERRREAHNRKVGSRWWPSVKEMDCFRDSGHARTQLTHKHTRTHTHTQTHTDTHTHTHAHAHRHINTHKHTHTHTHT